jgi:type I restriction enzyme M protein
MQEVWYSENPLTEGRKNCTETLPLQIEDFAPLIELWNKCEESSHTFKEEL